jgi:hypothetical protein
MSYQGTILKILKILKKCIQRLTMFELSQALRNWTFLTNTIKINCSWYFINIKCLRIIHHDIKQSWNSNIWNLIAPYHSLCSSGSRYIQFLGTFARNNSSRNLPAYLPRWNSNVWNRIVSYHTAFVILVSDMYSC